MSSRKHIFCFILAALAAHPGQAAKTSFRESHNGLLLQGGAYFPVFTNSNRFDPVTQMTPEGLTAALTKNYLLTPYKFGFYKEILSGRVSLDLYGIYLGNTITTPWTISGTYSGTGRTRFRGWGGGAALAGTFVRFNDFRIQFYSNVETIKTGVKLRFTADSGIEQALDLTTSSTLAGGGLRMDLRIADMWVLSLSGGYQYGLPGSYTATQSAYFLGNTHSGTLRDALSNDPIPVELGGLTADVGLRLDF